ncbi:hypothetical protein [Rubritalea tangerina]|uniref:DUF1080 domain-containing protein n=1 Tax=Rubritalea tangerina TaxID=430798 RepID=A0ABW4ZF85_9BACT
MISIRLASIFTLCTSLILPAYAETSARVHFADGDIISGNVIGLNDDIMLFKSKKFSNSAAPLKTSSILNVELFQQESDSPSSPALPDHLAEVKLEDRYGYEGEYGVLKGQLIQISDDSVTLNTSYAGELNIDRSLINQISIHSTGSGLYTGPNSLDEWTQHGSREAWKYSDNALIGGNARGSLSRDVNLPNQGHMSFEIDWQTNIGLTLLLFTDTVESSTPNNYYELRIQSNYITMSKRIKGQSSPHLDRNQNRNVDYPTEKAKYDLYMDKDKGKFDIYVNGKRINTFTDHTPTPDKLGTGLYLRKDNDHRLRLSEMRLEKWTGALPTQKDEDAFRDLKGEGQKLMLANGDAIIGKIGAIEDGILNIETIHTPLKVPLAKIRDLNLPMAQENHPRSLSGDIKAYYRDGGWITINVESIDEKAIHGSNEAIGKHSFQLSAFKKLELNVYNREFNKMRKEIQW